MYVTDEDITQYEDFWDLRDNAADDTDEEDDEEEEPDAHLDEPSGPADEDSWQMSWHQDRHDW